MGLPAVAPPALLPSEPASEPALRAAPPLSGFALRAAPPAPTAGLDRESMVVRRRSRRAPPPLPARARVSYIEFKSLLWP
ncbi:MAG: hypothetical protein U0235_13475 [Polyangiaceae bacterium]